MPNCSDQVRKSTLATLDEIVEGEKRFKEQHGIGIADEGEWMQLCDIVNRIERRLRQGRAE